MERHEILTDKIDWPNLVRHVVRDRVVVELAEEELPVTMLVPIERPKTMADLDKALRTLPRLCEDSRLVSTGRTLTRGVRQAWTTKASRH